MGSPVADEDRDVELEPAPETGASAADDAQDLWDEMERGAAPGASADAPPEQPAAAAASQDDEEEEEEQDEPPTPSQIHERDAPAAARQRAGRDRDDEWASAPPELRSKIDALVAERHRLGQELATARRTIGQERAERHAERQAFASPQGGAASGAAQPQGSFLDTDEAKALQSEYPEIASPLLKVIGNLESRLARQEMSQTAAEQARSQSVLAEQEALLREDHGDYAGFLSSHGKEFISWLDTQPRHIREAAQRNANVISDAAEASDVLTRFKAAIGDGGSRTATNGQTAQQLSGRRQRQLASTVAPQSRGPSASSGIPEEGDPKKIWDAFEEMERRKRG